MKIYNRERIITDKQLNKFLRLFNPKELPNNLYINENLIQVLKHPINLFAFNDEGWYNPNFNTIGINLYNLGRNKIDKQLYGLGVLIHELSHLEGSRDENYSDNRAKSFMNNNSEKIAEIMNWKDDYKIEEF